MTTTKEKSTIIENEKTTIAETLSTDPSATENKLNVPNIIVDKMTLVGNHVENCDEEDDRDVAVDEIGEDHMDLQHDGVGEGNVIAEEEDLICGTVKLLLEDTI